ncbi:MAG TPA: helix-turn-helix domain-containing protein, partial [Trebonia sp.]|nr:helix-turn-helix domain-containing protein [Trebonia sp.]
PIRRLGTVIDDDVALQPYADTLADGTPPPPGLQFAVRSAFADRESVPEVLRILAEVRASERSPFIAIRSVGGAVSRVPDDSTAYAHRHAELMVVTTSAGSKPVVDAARPALEAIWERLTPHVNGAYANFLSTATEEDVAAVYPTEVYNRLAAVKRQYDPGNLFARNHNVRPFLLRRRNPAYRRCVVDRDVDDALARSFLAGLPTELAGRLRAEGERADYPEGTTVYRAGDDPRAALVVRGLMRVYLSSPGGRQVTVRYARPGDVLGIAVLVGGPADTSVQAVEPSSSFRISARTLTEAARRDARVSWAIAEELNRRLYEVLEQTAVNAFGSVRQRVAAHLLDLASGRQRPGGRLVARVSQQELADAAGSVREVVARALRDLRAAGIVATAADSVVILDPARLYAESGGPAGL